MMKMNKKNYYHVYLTSKEPISDEGFTVAIESVSLFAQSNSIQEAINDCITTMNQYGVHMVCSSANICDKDIVHSVMFEKEDEDG